MHMKFRTTLGNGLVAIGQGNTHFSLQLRQVRKIELVQEILILYLT